MARLLLRPLGRRVRSGQPHAHRGARGTLRRAAGGVRVGSAGLAAMSMTRGSVRFEVRRNRGLVATTGVEEYGGVRAAFTT